jgi:hypothetical protein
MGDIDIIFDPAASMGVVEIETDERRSVGIGQWINRPDGFVVLRIRDLMDAENDPVRPD